MNSPSMMSRRPSGSFQILRLCLQCALAFGIVLSFFGELEELFAVEKAVRSSTEKKVADVPGTSEESETSTPSGPSTSDVVTFIDEQIAQGWTDNEISPSPEATDEEFVRRIYLDLCGRIPSTAEAREWLEDRSPRKKSLLTDRLLDDNDFVRNWTTIWTNLCIGRGNPRLSRSVAPS